MIFLYSVVSYSNNEIESIINMEKSLKIDCFKKQFTKHPN